MTKLDRIREDIATSACRPAGVLFELFHTLTSWQIDIAHNFLFDRPERQEREQRERVKRNLIRLDRG